MSMKGQPMNLTMKSVSALLLVGSLSACGGGGSNETGATANVSISGPGVTGSATASVVINNVDMLNKAKYLNGAEQITINATYSLSGSATDGTTTESINLSETDNIVLTATEAKNTNGIPEEYSFSFNQVYQGQTYQISGSYNINQGELRSDVAIVSGFRSNDFFITNEGTGTAIALTENQKENLNGFYTWSDEMGGNYTKFADDIANAHAEGWTGSGLELTLNKGDSEKLFDLLPNADWFTWSETQNYSELYNINTNDTLTVSSFNSADLKGFYIDELTEFSHAAVAAGVGTVWNKFDTLSSSQVADIVALTANGKRINLGAALSPVGNLN